MDGSLGLDGSLVNYVSLSSAYSDSSNTAILVSGVVDSSTLNKIVDSVFN